MGLVVGAILTVCVAYVILGFAAGRFFWTREGTWFMTGLFVLTTTACVVIGVTLVVLELQRPDWQHKNNPGFALAVYCAPWSHSVDARHCGNRQTEAKRHRDRAEQAH